MNHDLFKTMPFEELLTRARERQAGAVDELFRRSAERVEQWIRRETRPVGTGGDRPSDISQGILERILKGFDSFKGNTEGLWFGWLETIFKNDSKQSIRNVSRQKRAAPGLVSFDEDVPEPASPEKSQSQRLTQKQEHQRLYTAIFRLPGEQGRAIYLRYIKELDRDEVADSMKKTKSAAESLIGRGLTRLAREMGHLDPARTSSAGTPDANEAEAAFLGYLRKREAGEKIDMDAWLARHPTCAETLRGMVSLMEQLHTHALPDLQKKRKK